MTGKLYLVATPIGNLEDITLRAIKTLENVDLIAAEDTRHTLKLLNHLNISKPLFSYHRHNEETKSQYIIDKLLEGKNIALVSDAGTPVISDPGEEVVKLALENNITVIPIPGPCAFITALIASGIDAKEFYFLGFLPLNKKNRLEKLEEIKNATRTTIIYEAPHKLISTLKDFSNILENRKIVVAKELTKIHENFICGTTEELLKNITSPKGEYVLIIEKNKSNLIENNEFENMSLDEHYEYYKSLGFAKNEIIKKIAKDKKTSKNEIYMKFLDKK